MKTKKLGLLTIVVSAAFVSGCASYRTSSNVLDAPAQSVRPNKEVLIVEDSLPNRKYKEIGPIEVSVKKLTMFHKDPTKEQVNHELSEKAQLVGADAVVNVTYKSGVGFTTWGYMDAAGTGVKFVD